MRISLIVAMADNRVIGRRGAIPWRISADMKYFKQTTMGKPIIMGRKTFDSLGKALPGRANFVVTRSGNFTADGCEAAPDLAAALALANLSGAEEAMVIGGAEIYALALPQAERIYLTEIHGEVEGDTRFPAFDRDAWAEVSRDFLPREDQASHDCSFVILERT